MIGINAYPTYFAIGAFDKDAYKKLAKSFETGDDTDKENKFDWCFSWKYKKKVLILWTSHKFLELPPPP